MAESTLADRADDRDGGLIAAGVTSAPPNLDMEERETAALIHRLIREGQDDDAILKQVEPDDPDAMREAITYFRQRSTGNGPVADRGGTAA